MLELTNLTQITERKNTLVHKRHNLPIYSGNVGLRNGLAVLLYMMHQQLVVNCLSSSAACEWIPSLMDYGPQLI